MNVRNRFVSKACSGTVLWTVDFADICCMPWANLMWCWFDSDWFRPQHWMRSNKLHEMQCFYSQTENERWNITSTLVFGVSFEMIRFIQFKLRRLTCVKIVFVNKFIFLVFIYFQFWPDTISRYFQFKSRHSPNDVKIWHFISFYSRTMEMSKDDFGSMDICSIEWWTNYFIKFYFLLKI